MKWRNAVSFTLGVVLSQLVIQSCVRKEGRIPCTHENDKAAWAQSGMDARAYDSLMVATGKRCTP